MVRREFLALFAGATVAPGLSIAQDGRRPARIGFLSPGSSPDPLLDEFRKGLLDLGYIEGRNLTIETRFGERRSDRLDLIAKELVEAGVDVIVSVAGPVVQAARRQTATIPIVMAVSGDPLGTGTVASLARPGGNVTGLSFMSADLAGLRLAVLKEAVPAAARIAVLYNPNEPPTGQEMRETESAARALGVTLLPLAATSVDALEEVFARATMERADALITFAHTFAFVNRQRIVELAARHRVPAMYGWREYAEVGGLMAHGPNIGAMLRRAANFVDRILKGANPADMPIEQPAKLELVINLRTAKELGLELSPTVLARADEVIE